MEFDKDVVVKKLLNKLGFFGTIIANCNYIDTDEVDVAATDGVDIFYNGEAMKNYDVDQQTFILAHEVCHIAFGHVEKSRSENKNHTLWNIATDGVINALLTKKDKLKGIDGMVDIEGAENKDAEELYEILLEQSKKNKEKQKQQNENQPNGNNQGNGSSASGDNSDSNQGEKKNDQNQLGQGSNDGENDQKEDNSTGENGSGSNGDQDDKDNEENDHVGHDSHGMWRKKLDNKDNNRSNDNKGNNKDNSDSQDNDDADNEQDNSNQGNESEEEKERKEKINKAKEEISKLGEQRAFEKNEKLRKDTLSKLREKAFSADNYKAGKGDSGGNIAMGKVGISKPLIDWRYLLKQAIAYDDADWSYQNATIEQGIIRPKIEILPTAQTEIVLDTSGSIDSELLKSFLRECKNILLDSKVKVGCFDDDFHGFQEIKTIKDIDNLHFVGGGGTNFEAAVNAFSRNVENKIIFTDGYSSCPNTKMDAIWIVFGNTEINPPGGKVIYVSKEELMKANSKVAYR